MNINELLSNIDCVGFDGDGTLIDSRELHAVWLDVLAKEHRWQKNVSQSAEAVLYAMTNKTEDTLATYGNYSAVADHLNDAQRIFDALAKKDGMVKIHRGTCELLAVLTNERKRIAFITNSARSEGEYNVEMVHRAFYEYCKTMSRTYREPIELIVSKNDVVRAKPHADPIITMCDYFKSVPARSVIVGDTWKDIGCANSAGAYSIGLRTTEFALNDPVVPYVPTMMFSTLMELNLSVWLNHIPL